MQFNIGSPSWNVSIKFSSGLQWILYVKYVKNNFNIKMTYWDTKNQMDWLSVPTTAAMTTWAITTMKLVQVIPFLHLWGADNRQLTWYLPQMKSHLQPELCIAWLNMLQQQQEYWWDNCHHLEQAVGGLGCPTLASSALDHSWLGSQLSERNDSDIRSTGNVCLPIKVTRLTSVFC
jgi:hypothetical protein